MSDDVLYLSAGEIREKYLRKEISPVEMTKATLARIARYNPEINALVHVDEASALASATESESRWLRGEALGPLDGIPTTIKDNILTAGWPALQGSKTIDPDSAWHEDAPSVARLRASGAVLLGKTATPEFCWKGGTDSPLNGVTRNPWDLSKGCGGSSGGSAAALAAGMCTISLGTDGGGSIRNPAAFCGVFGLKPTFGRVAQHSSDHPTSLSVVGPLTRSASDAADVMDILCQTPQPDWLALPATEKKHFGSDDNGLAGRRIAFSPTLGYASNLDPEVASCVREAVKTFGDLGAQVDMEDPGVDDPTRTYNSIAWAVQSHRLRPVVERHARIMDQELVEIVDFGLRIEIGDYFEACERRLELVWQLSAFFARYDLLVTPTVPTTALEAGRHVPVGYTLEQMNDWLPFSAVFNLSRQPAATVPCGLTTDGMPIGMQIVGPVYGDRVVLQAAQAFERVHRPPKCPIFAPVGAIQ